MSSTPLAAIGWRAPFHSSEDAIRALTDSSPRTDSLGEDSAAARVLEIAAAWEGDLTLHRQITLGELVLGGPDSALPIDSALLPVSPLPFARQDADGASLLLGATWPVTLRVGGRTLSLNEALAEGRAELEEEGLVRLRLQDGEQAVVDLGPFLIIARRSRPARRVVAPTLRPEPALVVTTLTSMFLGGLAGLYALMAPPRPVSEVIELPSHVAALLLQVPPETPTPEPVKAQDRPRDAGEKAAKKEGKRGDPDARLARARAEGRERDVAVVNSAGVLGAWSEAGLESGSGLPGALSAGISGLSGPKGAQRGTGLGDRGKDFGGGGRAFDGDGVNTSGLCDGGDCRRGQDASFGEKVEGSMVPDPTEVMFIGVPMDRALIDRVIKQNMNRLRYCYQRELTKDPTLGGKVVVKFSIDKSGGVSSAAIKSSSLNNSAVESCMTKSFMSFKFPEPKGGGVVIVSYPFLFSPG
ncbi:AgmX/PglI C-terminal domain-containing protein [Myxococcota bacterium]|nr:AgmX/PglI C-terminal domain-containing protein [Myxococcota bacterium]